VFLGVGIFVVSFLLFYTKKHNRHLQEKIEMRSLFKQELLRTQLEIQEQTLKTISQEIHDNIGQVLSLAKLNLNTMELSKLDELQGKIINSKQLVSKAIQDLRDLSKSMNTDNIEAIGLHRSIEYELDMIRKTGFSTELNIEGSIIRIEPQKELILFRIVQEILNNIMKHAEAKTIAVKLNYDQKEIRVEINDDGKGFDLRPLNENSNSGFGIGIRNMHNRARLIGADFKMNSIIDKGTQVVVSIPVNNLNL
jgi:signal transduction histidine kinase